MTSEQITKELNARLERWWGEIEGSDVGDLWIRKKRINNAIHITTRKGQHFSIIVEARAKWGGNV